MPQFTVSTPEQHIARGSTFLVASSVGGILIDAYGFWAIGIFCFVCALISMIVVLVFVKEEPIDVEFVPL